MKIGVKSCTNNGSYTEENNQCSNSQSGKDDGATGSSFKSWDGSFKNGTHTQTALTQYTQ